MSLKGFHVLLISLSSLLLLVFGGWSLRGYTVTGRMTHLALAGSCFVLAAGLVAYVIWFARSIRTRDEEERRRRKLLRPLVLPIAIWALSTHDAGACSTCFGEASGPTIEAARLGVLLLFGLVFAVQLAFGLFFLNLWRKSRQLEESPPR